MFDTTDYFIGPLQGPKSQSTYMTLMKLFTKEVITFDSENRTHVFLK